MRGLVTITLTLSLSVSRPGLSLTCYTGNGTELVEKRREVCSGGHTHCYRAVKMEDDPQHLRLRRGCRGLGDAFIEGEGLWR